MEKPMKHCRHCLTGEVQNEGLCPVCGIRQDKSKGDLSPDEKKVRHHARTIRIVAMLHLIGVALGVIIPLYYPVPIAAAAVLMAINLMIAVGLSRYAFWAYKMATVYYFLIGMVNVISVNIPGVFMILILLYAIGNGTAKAIFERRLP
jgi:hypothetical protein